MPAIPSINEAGIPFNDSEQISDPDHLDVLKSPFLENQRLQPAHHSVFAVEKVDPDWRENRKELRRFGYEE